jgi:hypothetical protein
MTPAPKFIVLELPRGARSEFLVAERKIGTKPHYRPLARATNAETAERFRNLLECDDTANTIAAETAKAEEKIAQMKRSRSARRVA